MAEQRKQAEEQKTKELAKQIAQEREQEELDRISGKRTIMDRGIDWMYQGAKGYEEMAKQDAEKRAEEFLLGKEFAGVTQHAGDFDSGTTNEGINRVLSSNPPAVAAMPQEQVEESGTARHFEEPSVKERNENFRLRVEDPMFLVLQKQREKEKKDEKNRALVERVVGPTDGAKDSNDKNDYGSTERHRKRDKKKRPRRDEDDHHHERKQRRTSSRSRSNDRRRKHHRRDSRSSSRDRHEKERKHDLDFRNRRRDQDEQRRHSRKREAVDEGDQSRRHRESDKYGDRKRPSDDDRHQRHRHRQGEIDRCSERQDRRSEDRTPMEGSRRRQDQKDRNHQRNRSDCDNHPSESLGAKKEGYGLKGGLKSSFTSEEIGPDKELLRKKREEREAELRRIREAASSRRRLNEEERAKVRQEMQADARRREEVMQRKASQNKAINYDDGSPSKGNASFLQVISKRTHGVSSGDGETLSSRVAQNRHTNQRLHDSFL